MTPAVDAERSFRQAVGDDRFDVAIIGGGAMGLAIGAFLKRAGDCSVCVIEADPGFREASTPRASGGLRRLFSLPINIAMSDFSIRYFDALTRRDPDVAWTPQGYLFLAPPAKLDDLRRNQAIQQANGVDARWLAVEELSTLFPSLRTDDLGAAIHSPGDGWVDPPGVLRALHREAVAAGVELLEGRVSSFAAGRAGLTSLRLENGAIVAFDHVVNATGAWAQTICDMVGMRTPIEPMRRFEHEFEARSPIEPLPYIKDTEKLAFRPKGRGYTGGLPQYSEPGGFNFAVDEGYFDRIVRPALAHRVPILADCQLLRTTSGLYDQNRMDGNPIIGPWTDGFGNFHLAAGFSGHGLMHAPATAQAIAEMILTGACRTFDIECFGWRRVIDNRPLRETGII